MTWEIAPPPSETPPSELRGVGRFQQWGERIVSWPVRRFFSLRAVGTEHVPSGGPVLLTPNHDSMWDVPLLVIASPRPVVFMAKEEVFDNRLKAAFFTALGGFPVRRGGRDFGAMRRSLAAVRDGRVLCLYPEGTRHRGEDLAPFLPGAPWIALAEGVPLLPVGIRGTGEIWRKEGWLPRRVAVRIAFGEPIAVEREPSPGARRERAAELAVELRSRVRELLA